MTRRYITMGSLVNVHSYDDVDYDKAIVTEGPISAGAPVDDSDALRKEDMGSLVGIEGTVTGDIIRWNDVSGAWEVKQEPFDFDEIVLTPRAAALSDVKGGMYYSSLDDSIYVCTSDS